MLDPRDRRLLLEALRPPEGYEFDRAVGSSFSLDPTALLAVPLALAAFDLESDEQVAQGDSLALLEAVRRCAGRVSLFCQAGRIAVPAHYRSLLTYLEKSIVEVAAPTRGYVFHPKAWLVRYVDAEAVFYRFLCLSRNLTFDRSWDTALVLEGPLLPRKNAIAVNHPLGDFVAALPGLAVREVSARVADDVARLAHEVRRVRFEVPEGFDGLNFLPLGLGRPGPLPFAPSSRKGLVVSPFLGEGLLRRLPQCADGTALVSLDESLLAMGPEVTASFAEQYVLSAAAELQPEADDDALAEPPLSGLHAKLYVFDEGWTSRVWTGSANATQAAFGGNVEFLVELRGRRSVCGVDATLGKVGDHGLIGLLEEFAAPQEAQPSDALKRALERRLDDARAAFSSLPLRLAVDRGGARNAFRMSLRLEADSWAPPPGVSAHVWPVSLLEEQAVACRWGEPELASFGEVSLEAITPFLAVRLTVEQDERRERATFSLNLPMDGEPANREALVLRQLIRHPQDLVALLLLLLADDDLSMMDALQSQNGDGNRGSTDHGLDARGLLEALVRQLDRDPRKLRAVKRLVDDLERTTSGPDGAAGADLDDELDGLSLLPPGFAGIWAPVWAAARQLGVRDV